MISIVKILQFIKLLIPFLAELFLGGKSMDHLLKAPWKNKLSFFTSILVIVVALYSTTRVFQLASQIIALNAKISQAEIAYQKCSDFVAENESLLLERKRLFNEIHDLREQLKDQQKAVPATKAQVKKVEQKPSLHQSTIDEINSKLTEGVR